MTEVAAVQSLDHAELRAVRCADAVEPCLVVEPDRFHDEVVAFPAADGIAHPGWIRIRRQRAAIGEDLSIHATILVEHEDDASALRDLDWRRLHPCRRHSRRKTSRERIVFA